MFISDTTEATTWNSSSLSRMEIIKQAIIHANLLKLPYMLLGIGQKEISERNEPSAIWEEKGASHFLISVTISAKTHRPSTPKNKWFASSSDSIKEKN